MDRLGPSFNDQCMILIYKSFFIIVLYHVYCYSFIYCLTINFIVLNVKHLIVSFQWWVYMTLMGI